MVTRRTDDPQRPAQADPAYAPAAKTAIQAVTRRVQEMHTAISNTIFKTLRAVPGLSAPFGLVQRAHDAVAGGVYGAVLGGTAVALDAATEAERIFRDAGQAPTDTEIALRSALNAVAGDALADQRSGLALPMSLLVRRVVLNEQTAPAVWTGLGERVAIFVHGLGCSETCWHLFPQNWHGQEAVSDANYGALLQRDLSIQPLYLRYNTGLPIAANASTLNRQLSLFAARAPQVREIVLIGHSMGGLVARLACDQAEANADWLQRVRCVVCLGSPNLGAPLEQVGHLLSEVLGASRLTQPLQTLANTRSQGIKDLGRGITLTRPGPPLRLVAGDLVVTPLLGDGLVTRESALDGRALGDVDRADTPGLSHMALLNHPLVYACLQRWLRDVPRG